MPTHLRRSTSPGTSAIAPIPFLEYVFMTASRTSKGWRSSFIFSTLFSVWPSLRNRTYRLPSYPVKTTLGLLQIQPAPGPGVLVRRHRPRARLATDALVALFEQRVDGNVMLGDVLVDPLLLHEGERRDLGRPVAGLPGEDRRVRPLGRLLAPNPGHPGVVTLERPSERAYFTDLAAEIRGAGPHLLAVTLDLLLDRKLRPQNHDRQLVAPHDPLAKLDSLLEQETRVYGEDRDLVRDAGEHVQKGHPLGPPEGSREREPVAVGLDRPLEYLPRRGALETFVNPREFLGA